MKKYSDLLKASFDRKLNSDEAELLNSALLKYPELQVESTELQQIREVMARQKLKFSPGFTQKVLQQINSGIDHTINNAFLRIAVPGLAAAIALLLISLFSGNPASIDTLMGIDLFKPEYLTDFIFFNN